MSHLRDLSCSVCGSGAGRFRQHWNRDTGWGLCAKCRDWLHERGTSPEEMADLYGIAGVNYEAKTHTLMGRKFEVLAEFPETEVDRANRYMEAHPGASVLEVVGGVVILADKKSMGVAIK